MSKETVSNAYIEQQHRRHAHLRLAAPRRVVITGTSRPAGIGAAIAARLHADGALVTPLDTDVRCTTLNSTRMDTLILCHGVTHLDWLEDAPLEKVREIIDVNLTANIQLTQQFVGLTLETECRKQIFFIGSMAHRAVLNGSAAYCASKAGLQHFARCAAWELAPKGYNVYCINPSNTVGTQMTEDTIRGLMRYRNLSRAEAEAYWGAVCPKGRWLTPGDVAELVSWLFTGHGEFLSGAALDLPGGQR